MVSDPVKISAFWLFTLLGELEQLTVSPWLPVYSVKVGCYPKPQTLNPNVIRSPPKQLEDGESVISGMGGIGCLLLSLFLFLSMLFTPGYVYVMMMLGLLQ